MAAPVGTEQTADISVAISGLIWPLAPVGDKRRDAGTVPG
jgi:hypothetical protein